MTRTAGILLLLLAPLLLVAAQDLEVEDSLDSKTVTADLSSSTLSVVARNMLYVVPALFFIIVLDFAIFGAFAKRSDNLNPISEFFFHVRRGFGIVRSKGAPRPGRYGRSIEVLGPILEALTAGQKKYNQ